MAEPSFLDDFRTWADLSASAALAQRYDGDAERAFDDCSLALTARNVAVRRNGIRVLRRVFEGFEPLPEDEPCLLALERARFDGRPLVMHEAEAAWRELRGLPANDMAAPYPGIPGANRGEGGFYERVWGGTRSPALMEFLTRLRRREEERAKDPLFLPRLEEPPRGDLSEAELATSLGQRTLVHLGLNIERRSDFEGRRISELLPADRTPSEEAYVWMARGESVRGSSAFWILDFDGMAGARKAVLARIKRDLPHTSKEAHRQALEFVSYLEDPLALDAVASLTSAPQNASRRKAIIVSGILGDERVLEITKRSFAARDRDVPACVWALGFLGDVRGYELLWQAVKDGLSASHALEVMGMMGELATQSANRVLDAPELFKHEGARRLLFYIVPGREFEQLAVAFERAGPKRAERALRAFAIDSQAEWRLEFNAVGMEEAGFVREPSGAWRWNPVGPAPTGPGGTYDSNWDHAQSVNEVLGAQHTVLRPSSRIGAWTGELLRHYKELVGDPGRPLPERAAALRKLRVVAGTRADKQAAAALEAVVPAEAEAIARLAQAPLETAKSARAARPPEKGSRQ